METVEERTVIEGSSSRDEGKRAQKVFGGVQSQHRADVEILEEATAIEGSTSSDDAKKSQMKALLHQRQAVLETLAALCPGHICLTFRAMH